MKVCLNFPIGPKARRTKAKIARITEILYIFYLCAQLSVLFTINDIYHMPETPYYKQICSMLSV